MNSCEILHTMTDDIIRLAVSLILVSMEIVVSEQTTQQCSKFCTCDSWYGLQRASCTNRHLYSIDTGAPDTVQALDLSDNVISLLSNYQLMNAGFTKLKYLNLSRNSISEIDLNAFDELTDLTVLDLSRNHLYYILADVFVNNKNLKMLKLSGNNFNFHVPKLQSSSLTELSLDSCRISHLPLNTFNGLTHVRRLDLSDNLMIQLSSSVVQTLHLLKKLSLDGNPWSCNRVMHDLQVHLKHRNVEFEDVCEKKTNPKKFETMVLSPERRGEHDYLQSATVDQSSQKTKSVIKYNVSHAFDNKNASTCEDNSNLISNGDLMWQLAPYWFLFIGFLAGISSGMIISYVWLSGMFPCDRRYRHCERLNDVSQRLSWLFDSYLQNRIDSNATLIESCPGTPPPPYREVMLRPNFYHYPSTASNLNDNSTGYR